MRLIIKMPFLVFLLLTFLSSCAHLVHLDRAQDAFSHGATIENADKLTTQELPSVSPSSYYNLAYAEIKKALQHRQQLRSDTVLGNAYAIKALCEWKLKRYELALGSADLALQEFKEYEKAGIRMSRDKALMKALGGLIEIEKANDSLYQFFQSPPSSRQQVALHFTAFIYNPDTTENSKLEAALNILEKAKAEAGKNHEIQTYFILSQLAAIKVWSDAHNFCSQYLKTPASTDSNPPLADQLEKWEEDYSSNRKHLMDQLAEKLPRGKEHPTWSYWNMILGQ